MRKIIILLASVLTCLCFFSCEKSSENDYPIAILPEQTRIVLNVGESANLKINAKYSDGRTQNITSECRFELKNSSDSEFVKLQGSKVTAKSNEKNSVPIMFYYKKNVGIISISIR